MKNNLYCHAARDGDCFWEHCPQHLERRGHCPLDVLKHVYFDEDGFVKSDKHAQAWGALVPSDQLGGARER